MALPIKILRADHVELFYTYLGVPLNPVKAERGWLVLTETGEVNFYAQRVLDTIELPTFTAPSVNDFSQKVAKTFVRGKFGTVSRFVFFTGFKYQAGDTADIEGVIGTAASAAGNELIGTLGSGAGVLSEGLEYARNRGFRKQKQEAKDAWFPVLTGKRRWQDINLKEEP
jgi:hypothetical protein